MSKNIGVLTTGRIVPKDLAKVFGSVPISFLPYKGKRIIDWQIESLINNANLEKLYVLFPNKEWGKEYKVISNKIDIEYLYVNSKDSLMQIINDEFEFFNLSNFKNLIIYHGDILIRSNDLKKFSLTEGNCSITASNVSKTSSHYPNTEHGYHLGLIKYNQPANFMTCVSKYKTFWDFMEREYNTRELCHSIGESYLSTINFSEFTDSRSKDFMSRSFNNVSKHDNRIIKRSSKKDKIKSEYMWYLQTPDFLKDNIPSVYNLIENDNDASYEMDYINSVALSDVFVFGYQNDEFIQKCLKYIYKYIDSNFSVYNSDTNIKVNADMIDKLFFDKTIDRLESYKQEDIEILEARGVSLNYLYNKLDLIKDIFMKNKSLRGMIYWHGDFCFSNILYEPFEDKIYFIDPRGSSETNSGLLFYDICKLGHSIIGGYDFIMALSSQDNVRLDNILDEDFNLSDYRGGLYKLQSQRSFVTYVKKLGYSIDDVLIGIGLLFISMIPLHTGIQRKQYLIQRGLDFLEHGETIQNTTTSSRKV